MSASTANRLYDIKSEICTPEFSSLNLGVGEKEMRFKTIYNHPNCKYEVSLERSLNKLLIGSMQILMTSLMTSLEVQRSTMFWPSENPEVPASKGVNISYAGTEQEITRCNF